MESLLKLEYPHGIWSPWKNIGYKGRDPSCLFRLVLFIIHDIRGQFGVVVLSLAWMPGIVAVIHMLAFYRQQTFFKGSVFQRCKIIYRKDYAVKCKDECKELHRNRRKIFLIQLVLILLFFPFVPAIIYSQILWVWGIKNVSINTLEKRENLARQIRGEFDRILSLIFTTQ